MIVDFSSRDKSLHSYQSSITQMHLTFHRYPLNLHHSTSESKTLVDFALCQSTPSYTPTVTLAFKISLNARCAWHARLRHILKHIRCSSSLGVKTTSMISISLCCSEFVMEVKRLNLLNALTRVERCTLVRLSGKVKMLSGLQWLPGR